MVWATQGRIRGTDDRRETHGRKGIDRTTGNGVQRQTRTEGKSFRDCSTENKDGRRKVGVETSYGMRMELVLETELITFSR